MKILQKEEGVSRSISTLEAQEIVERVRVERNMENNEAFQSIVTYLRMCPSLESASWGERARKILTEGGMTNYEASLVLNLNPERHIDAKALIPSLSRLDNYVINHLLNEISDIANN